MTVGRSYRTPAKHALMRDLFLKEAEAAARIPDIRELLWLDLTAGDGDVPDDGTDRAWQDNCSPGILAHAALSARKKPVRIILHEKHGETFRALLEELDWQLDQMNDGAYSKVSEGEWEAQNGRVRLSVSHQDGYHAGLDGVGRHTAVYSSNDPNAVTGWAMRPGFAREIAELTPWYRALSTMGCNAGGVKKGLKPEERMDLCCHVLDQVHALPGREPKKDLLLVKIDRDSDQWAYLLTEPEQWRGDREQAANRAFGNEGLSVTMAWWTKQQEDFRDLLDELFLTKAERGVK
jgi:hypothetical protein